MSLKSRDLARLDAERGGSRGDLGEGLRDLARLDAERQVLAGAGERSARHVIDPKLVVAEARSRPGRGGLGAAEHQLAVLDLGLAVDLPAEIRLTVEEEDPALGDFLRRQGVRGPSSLRPRPAHTKRTGTPMLRNASRMNLPVVYEGENRGCTVR